MNTIYGQPNITERWKITQKMMESTYPIEKRQKMLSEMIGMDNSDTMKNKKITCENILQQDPQ